MDQQLRVVTEIPMRELWGPRHPVPAGRLRGLDRSDLVLLLNAGKVQFIIANVGDPLVWQPLERCYEFWKAEVQDHLVDPGAHSYRLEDFPGEYAYRASEWRASGYPPLVLLEKEH
jgi:hypothetical protein